jgi:glycosyltransferase involved in cell wall biosynthesis
MNQKVFKKILYPIGSIYPSQQGGPSNSIYWACLALKKIGADVTIVSTDVSTDGLVTKNQWVQSDFGEVIYNSEYSYKFPVKSIIKSLKQVRKCDIVHLNSLFYPLSIVVFVMSILCSKTIIWSVRGELSPESLKYSKHIKYILKNILYVLINKKVHFHSTSDFESRCIIETFGKDVNIKYLPNFMLLPHKLNLQKCKRFTYIGRFHRIKGLDNLIYALDKSMYFKSSDFEFHFAGFDNSEYSNYLLRLVSELQLENKIYFINYITGYEKQEFLSRSYFNFLPSHSENFGLVVIESLAQGTPVVASTNTPWNILEVKNAGYFVDNDIDSLAMIIDEIISNVSEENYKIISDNAHRLATDDFDVFSNTNLMKVSNFYFDTVKL